MVRPVTIHEKPIFVPYVCIQCGLGGPPRTWFVDLGFALDHYFNTGNTACYLCNECYSNMTDSVGRLLHQFLQDRAAWQGEVEPTYEWAEEHDIREPESSGSISGNEGDTESSTGATSGSDGNDQDTESNDSESEPTDSGDANSTDDSSSTGSGQSSNLSASFGSGSVS